MRKVLIITLFALSAALGLAAQNNPYAIDDECYRYFQESEMLVGKDGFEEASEALMRSAILHNDPKAQTLYYVGRLKDYIRRIPVNTLTTQEQDAEVEKRQKTLMSIAKKTGYKQYYYYAYELVQNYYYNHLKPVRTLEIVQQMQAEAIENKDEYGLWMGNRYMVALYISQNDYINAQKWIAEALRIYEDSQDPTVRRQSVCRLYCDLADTYPVGSDSVRININRAIRRSQVHLDTLRCRYHLAKLSAYEGKIDDYERYRNYCLKDPLISQISRSAIEMFENIDNILKGRPDLVVLNPIENPREVKMVAAIAEANGQVDLALKMQKSLVGFTESSLSISNKSKLSEIDARLGNKALSADLQEKSTKLARVTRLVMFLITFLLLGLVTILTLHIRNLRRSKQRDEQRIVELKEANERVMMADAAKTRFVQNMSHEVRTPLNAIVGFSQLLSLPDGSFSAEEKDEFSAHIINNTKMLTMLLDDILNTSAMDNGNYSIVYEQGECRYMCEAAISSAEHRLQPGVSMRYEPAFEGPFSFRTDPRRVQQIIINLLTNACKHTTEGEIVLSCSLEENPGEVSFSVTDTGPGVPAEQAEAIFDRFTKLNDFVQGTGLGLSICRDIASKMGGRVYLDTTYKRGGARFVLALPIDAPVDNKTN